MLENPCVTLAKLYRSLKDLAAPGKTFYARMFRRIVRDLKLHRHDWHSLELHYVANPANGLQFKKRYIVLNNLRRKVARPGMTLQGFKTALNFLGVTKAEWFGDEIVLDWRNGVRTLHRLG